MPLSLLVYITIVIVVLVIVIITFTVIVRTSNTTNKKITNAQQRTVTIAIVAGIS